MENNKNVDNFAKEIIDNGNALNDKLKPLVYQVFEKGEVVNEFDLFSKKVILCLHGWGGGLASFEGSAKVLSKNYSVVCVDFKSIEGDKVLQLSDYKVAVENLVQKLNINKFNILAHSFGARVAFLLAADQSYKDRIEKILLVGPAGIKPKFSIIKSCKVVKYKIFKLLYNKKIITIEKLNSFGSNDYKSLNSIMKQTFNNIIKHDCLPHIKKITAKTLIVNGAKDSITPLYMAKKINKNIKGSELYVFKELGHFCYLKDSITFNLVAEMFFSV